MAREELEVVGCDYGGCDNTCTPARLNPTGWLLGDVVNRESSLDLCPEHREEIQELIEGGDDGQ